ncbi:unnamed protein product [Cuscuta epithymum]|uniref:Uncharacterized protein n=1 Tax=Cuscuta epithymum TaxID=186058 RepID=A0AAV0FWZ2_9ASTE|nr:unnamed protein product [Cuscuta epithymum]
MSLATSSLSVNNDGEISPAEKQVTLWAKRTGQALTRQQLRALAQVLENNDVQDMDCLSWVLLGWSLRGESQLDEMINVLNSLQSNVSACLASNESFRKESCQLIKGLKVKLSQHAMAPKNQFLQPPIIPQPEQTLNFSGTLLTKEMSTSSVPSANVKTSGMPCLKSLLKRQAPMKAPAVPKAVPSVLSVNEKMAAIINSTVSGNFQDGTYSPEDVASFLAAMLTRVFRPKVIEVILIS